MRFGIVNGPDALVRWSPTPLGVMFALGLAKKRRGVEEQLLTVGCLERFGAYSVFSNYAHALTEALAIGSGRNVPLVANVNGNENYQRAKAIGRGVIVATAHTSGWYAAGPVLGSLYSDEVLLVMERERDARAAEVQENARRRLGLKVAYVGGDPLSALPLIGHLKKGGVVAMQADRTPAGHRMVEVRSEDRAVPFPEGITRLASLTGAPIVTVVGKRVGQFSYSFWVESAVLVARRPTHQELVESSGAVWSPIEKFIRRNPTHWFPFER